MLDFYSGWTVPRHLYRSDKYKIWGKLPYEKGDYMADQVFRMVWPGYEDASYLRNERGFVCDTPFGDMFDVVTNRCGLDALRQYTSVMLLGDVEMTPDAQANLTRFVEEGGDLLIDARTARRLPADFTGLTVGDSATGCTSCLLSSGEQFGEQRYTYSKLGLQGADALVVSEASDALLTVHGVGKGRVIVCSADYWMTDKLTYARPELVNMEPPYRLLRGVQDALEGYFDSLNPVGVSPQGLNVRTCFFADDPKRMLVGLMNNDLFADWSGTMAVRIGSPVAVRELVRGGEVTPGPDMTVHIAAGDVAVLDVRMQ